jgi:ABC-type multidrug transport system fused ATPase/permease subunit
MNVGDFFIELIKWFFSLLSNFLPNDLFQVNQKISNFLSLIKEQTISFFSVLSIYFDLKLFFILILIVLTLPAIFVAIKLLSRGVRRIF